MLSGRELEEFFLEMSSFSTLSMGIPQETVCPRVEDRQVKEMLYKNYGMTVASLKPLNGYDDKNYHAVMNTEFSNPYVETVCKNGYLVKVVNHLDSKLADFQMGQKIVMDQLNASGIPCQKELKTVNGDFFCTISVVNNGESVTHMVSVRSFLDGDTLHTTTLTTGLAYDVGIFTASIFESLKNVEFDFFNDFTPMWNMENFWKVKKVLHAVIEPERFQVAEDVFDAFESVVVPRKAEFRKGMIHGDINEQNILVQNSITTPGAVEITGVIDFQDTSKSYPIYDFAIAVSYMMMVTKTEVPLLDVGGHMIAGYNQTTMLNEAERKSLKTLIASRMVMSLVYGAYFHFLDPSNEYFLTTSYLGWNILLEFWRTEEDAVWERWIEIIESYNK